MSSTHLEGRTLSGRYQIKSTIGQGGMAAVFQGYDPNLRRNVAIKVIHSHLSTDAEFLRRFEEEATAIARLRHANIVQVHDFNHDGDLYYMVMEFITGETLQNRLKRLNETNRRLPLVDAVKYAVDICEAADYAHQRGMIHRDIKPANVMLDVEGKAILMDFGIARMLGGAQHTATGALLGTAKYMSPEQIQGLHADARADIYAIGVMLFEMVSGRPPFEADSAMTLMMMHMNDPLPDLRELQPEAPLALINLIEKATAKNRDSRYASAAQMAEALKEIKVALPTHAPARPTAPPPPVDVTFVEKPQAEATRIEQPPAKGDKRQSTADQTALEPAQPGAFAPATQSVKPFPASPEQSAHPVTRPRSRSWVLIVLGVLLVGVLGVSGALLLRNGESPGAVPTLPTSVISSSTPTAELPATQAVVVLPATATLPPAATATSANTPTTAPTATELPTNTPEPAPVLLTIGGADKIAYLDGNNIWAANLDGSGLIQLTSDATSKSYLRWLPDGQSLSYLSGKCIQTVTLEGEVRVVTCFNNSEYLDAFEISPDGTQVVISLDRQLYLLPFDLEGLSQANSHGDLAALATCPELAPYQRNSARMVRWSRDGSQWAALVIGVLADGRRGDLVNVFAVDTCIANPRVQLQFPEPHFTFREYEKNPGLESIAWDGDALFAFHGFTRNDGFGELHIFNMETYAASLSVNPVNGVCCYRDPQWSPDGTHLLFVFQNYLQGADSTAQIYYIPYGSIGTGAAYEPLPLPDLRDPRAKPWPVLRPAAGP